MKKALKDKLISKYPGVFKKLTPKGQEILVEKLAAKLTSEDEIEDFVNGLENVIEAFVDMTVSEADRRVKEAVDKVKPPKKDDDIDDDGNPKDNPKDVAGIIAAEIAKALAPLQAQLAAEKGKTTHATLLQKAKEKGIPEALVKRYAINDDFNEENALTELEADWTEIKQLNANTSTDGGSTLLGSSGGKDVSAAIKNFTKQQVETNKKD